MSFSLSEYTKIDVPTGRAYIAPQSHYSTSWFQGGRFATGGEGGKD